MTRHNTENSRRRFLFGSALALAPAIYSFSSKAMSSKPRLVDSDRTVPFYGLHQSGITTFGQRHTYFVAFDLDTDKRTDLMELLRTWTDTAAKRCLHAEQVESSAETDPVMASGSSIGLPVGKLTVTFGFGASLFEKEGVDRFGIRKLKPEALVDLPRFIGDQIDMNRTGGDLAVQVSGDDFQAVEALVRQLTKVARGAVSIRWGQPGFAGGFSPQVTPRNQMGFKDGTMNIDVSNESTMSKWVWIGNEGPAWLRGGSYMVIRPIRIALDHWDAMTLAFQEQSIGRHKISGSPLGKVKETDKLDLKLTDSQDNLVIPEFSHAAMAAPENNDGIQILRHAFNYDNGIIKVAERWPPWRQLNTFDAGLIFQCYQRDPRTGFIPLFKHMAQFDMLNQFTTHIASGLYVCPPGSNQGSFIGAGLFE